MTDTTPQDAFSGVKPVEERHKLDEAALASWLAANVEGFEGPLQVFQFKVRERTRNNRTVLQATTGAKVS